MEYLDIMAQFVATDYSITSQFFLVFLFVLIIVYYAVQDYGVPPGPIGVPILGYWPFLSKNIGQQEKAWKEKYGDVYSYRVAGKLIINIASRKVLREAYISKFDCFAARPYLTLLSHVYPNAIGFIRGEKWKNTRKFFLTQLKERGLYHYQEHCEATEFINNAICSFIDDLRRNADGPVDILTKLSDKNSDILVYTLFGPKSPIQKEEISKIQECHRVITSMFKTRHLILVGKIANFLIVPFLPWKKAVKVRKIETEKIKRMVEEHKISFDNLNIRDIIDSYIDERNRRKSEGDPTAEYFTDEILVDTIFQTLSDGLNVGQFFLKPLKILLNHPDEQEKIYKELVEVCGEDRNPTISDRRKTTYTTAFLYETIRTTDRQPFVDLECLEETTLAGYRIPKGAVTLVNTNSIHNDPEGHKDPEKFNPERFISKDGKPREDLPVSFGIGKRSCMGESLLLMMKFLFVAALVKNFKMSYTKSGTEREKDTHRATKFEICISPRNDC